MTAAAETCTRALTERQRRFAEHYARTGNGAESCRLAGYANKAARIAAQQVLSNSNVVALVDELRKEHLNAIGVRPDAVLKELAASAFVDPKDAFDEDGDLLPVHRMPHDVRRAIKKIRIRKRFDKKTGEQIGEDTDVEFNDKLRANEILGRHLGILKETPVQVNQHNVFAAIVERVQGSALQPIAQPDDDDTPNAIDYGEQIIEGTVVEKSDVASDDTLAVFGTIDEGEDENAETPAVAQTTEDADRAVPESERKAFKRLWRRPRRRNI